MQLYFWSIILVLGLAACEADVRSASVPQAPSDGVPDAGGGHLIEIAPSVGLVTALLPDVSGVYVNAMRDEPRIVRFDSTTGTSQVIAETTASFALAINATQIFWKSDEQVIGRVKATGAIAPIGRARGYCYLAADDRSIYAACTGSIVRIPLDGGDVDLLATLNDSNAVIGLDGDHVCWNALALERIECIELATRERHLIKEGRVDNFRVNAGAVYFSDAGTFVENHIDDSSERVLPLSGRLLDVGRDRLFAERDGTVYALSLGSGTVETLVEVGEIDQPIWKGATDGTDLIVASMAGHLVRIRRE